MLYARPTGRPPRWHLIYLALAAFDILTVMLSLGLSHRLMTSYAQSAQTNSVWAQRLGAISRLGDLAQETNAPGNDIFDSGAVALERARRDQALARFTGEMARIHSELEKNTSPSERVRLEDALDATRVAMGDMVGQSDQIFGYFEAGDRTSAGQRMASMDRAYARLTRSISTSVGIVQQVQAAHLKRQVASAHDLQAVERLIAVFILMMVTGVTLYGHNLGKVMRRQARAMDEAREAGESNRAKSIFLASMSHEIRTPMNGILGMARLIDTSAMPPAEREKVAVILESGQSLMTLLNDVLDISKIEAGKLDICPTPGDLLQTVHGACRLFEAQAGEKGLDLVFRAAPELQRNLSHDPVRVRQAVNNLISNAIKFTQAGQVTVAVSTHSLAEEGCHLVTVEVSDSGIGMSVAEQANVFRLFTQADSSTTRRFGGTGLGLSICRDLARLMGGDVTVESAPNQGSCFTLTFKALAHTLDPTVVPESNAGLQPGVRALAGLRLLVTDDHPVNRQILRLFLEPMGFAITEATNGREALDLLATASFDLMLLDVHMPVMDGTETIRHIRASSSPLCNLPVIALTGDAMVGDREKLLALGMSAYLPKPIDPRDLLVQIALVLETAAGADPAEEYAVSLTGGGPGDRGMRRSANGLRSAPAP